MKICNSAYDYPRSPLRLVEGTKVAFLPLSHQRSSSALSDGVSHLVRAKLYQLRLVQSIALALYLSNHKKGTNDAHLATKSALRTMAGGRGSFRRDK